MGLLGVLTAHNVSIHMRDLALGVFVQQIVVLLVLYVHLLCRIAIESIKYEDEDG